MGPFLNDFYKDQVNRQKFDREREFSDNTFSITICLYYPVP